MSKKAKQKQFAPHYGVFTRLKPSRIHGVGVFAIQDIPKGVRVFYGDDDELVWVDKEKIKSLSTELKKMYEDFGVIKGSLYGCPGNFNNLTSTWYVNHSIKPNLVCDADFNFIASRRIKKGEELTIDYKTYSDR